MVRLAQAICLLPKRVRGGDDDDDGDDGAMVVMTLMMVAQVGSGKMPGDLSALRWHFRRLCLFLSFSSLSPILPGSLSFHWRPASCQ